VATLTFDDGPDPRWTPLVLDALAAAGVHGTFFLMAGRAERQQELVERIASDGHELELHCLEHVRHTRLSRDDLERDTDRALDRLLALGVRPRRWRPPWGALAAWSADVATERGLDLTGWTVDPEDWSGRSAAAMLRHVTASDDGEPVVLLHDGVGPGARRDGCAETVALIGPLVERLRAGGVDVSPLGTRRVPVRWPR
jgi:peptidoglycan/xylan/chitin deacetylase (PgdA/CDA1 family)